MHSDPMFIRENLSRYKRDGVFQIDIGPNDSRVEEVLRTSNVILSHANKWYYSIFRLNCPNEIKAIEKKYFITSMDYYPDK
jgi:hypothetical protein